MNTPLLEARSIRKQFPGVLALDGVSLAVQAGEVLAVIGENGAGKSTLMKVLAGIYRPDAGSIHMNGEEIRPTGVADALRRGIVLIHQELNLAGNLSIAANVFLGREKTRFGLLDQAAMDRETQTWLQRVGLDAAPSTRVDDLTIGQQQMVEIARALAMNARVLIMDEPTSSLTQRETDRLYEVIADLKQSGVAILYISHRLAEVKRIADRVVVLRDGKNSGELSREQINHQAMVSLMVGRDVKQFYTRQHAAAEATVPRLELREIRFAGGSATPLSLTLRPGEIVGLAGLVGAGRTELAEALFGIRPLMAGQVLLDGNPIDIRNPRQAIASGLLLVPEDRRLHGLVLLDTVEHNLALPNLDRLSFLRLVVRGREDELARQTIDQLHIRTPGPRQTVGLLSGGNQQKVVLGKWLARQPRLLILDEPTRGVDVGAKSEIYGLMDKLAGEGVTILMISSDLEEVLGMSDRVLVLHEGRLAGELPRAELSEQAIMNLATGGRAEVA